MTESESQKLVREAEKWLNQSLVFSYSTHGKPVDFHKFIGTKIYENDGDFIPKSVMQDADGNIYENDLEYEINRFEINEK